MSTAAQPRRPANSEPPPQRRRLSHPTRRRHIATPVLPTAWPATARSRPARVRTLPPPGPSAPASHASPPGLLPLPVPERSTSAAAPDLASPAARPQRRGPQHRLRAPSAVQPRRHPRVPPAPRQPELLAADERLRHCANLA
nr:extensin-like [Aegilops tauschii subsp. strangulata]